MFVVETVAWIGTFGALGWELMYARQMKECVPLLVWGLCMFGFGGSFSGFLKGHVLVQS